jgi:putative heme-binding domain-containing protein
MHPTASDPSPGAHFLRNRPTPTTLAAGLALLGLAQAVVPRADAAEDPFAANVRPTEPLTAEQQVRTLKVPAGFEVQLVAAEPDIHKPMNLAFDAAGRLWVTTSREYPTPVKVGEAGRDRVQIFEDFGPDGRARKVTTFADGLNIPIGVYPFRSPATGSADPDRTTWKAIVWSIPNLWMMEDTDGDGKADKREKLYGPFDHTRDTHGNQASFRRGFDGWLYATHGYNNDSHVAGRDGHRVDMNSGNTYRVRLDGSRIEQNTWGQVNPFGMAFDPQGNLWSSDCHSEPIYFLLQGAYYPSFGKPHDGLGFAPNTMLAVRGSTAIDALSYYADDLWPEEYRNCVFIGDVMTSRVYRDRAVPQGSGWIARAEPDFVVSEDPWFRPVDSTLGPDGALYIADFYNRIIGHYEVPLSHPGRDRERGRIFRVVPTAKKLRPPALAEGLDGLITELGSPSLPRRMLAMQDLADRFGSGSVAKLRELLDRSSPETGAGDAADSSSRINGQVHALWLLERFGALEPERLTSMAGAHDPMLRLHAQRILIERGTRGIAGDTRLRESLKPLLARLSLPRLSADPDPVVRRLAARALGTTPDWANVQPLLAELARTDVADRHLVYTLRQSLRDQLLDTTVMVRVIEAQWSDAEVKRLADVAVAAKTEGSGAFLARVLGRLGSDQDLSARALAHASRYAPAGDVDGLVHVIRETSGVDLDRQLGLFRSIQQGLAQRGATLSPTLRAWAGELAPALLESVSAGAAWSAQQSDGGLGSEIPWDLEERQCADGVKARLMSSLPHGEHLTGVFRSRPFAAPATLSFFLCGHDGLPDKPARKKNLVRLRDATTSTVLREVPVPRNDVARRVSWDLADLGGRQVVLEAVDADAGESYAWIAFGRLDPASVPSPTLGGANAITRQIAVTELALASGREDLKPAVARLARDGKTDPAVRAAAARALTEDPLIRAAADLVGDPNQPHAWRTRTADVLFAEERQGVEDLIAAVWKDAPQRFQARFAGLAAATSRLTGEILDRMADGRAPAGLLLDRRLRDRLRQSADDTGKATLDRLVKSLPAEDPVAVSQFNDRRTGFNPADASVSRGRDVFMAACSVCHQISGLGGGLVGPQLTGIGTRGFERLCEDILLPNRNVDRMFWSTALTLKDGDSVTGLFRREEGELLVLANAAGAEFTVRKADVAERKEAGYSLMPTNFGEALPVSDFYGLLAFLVSQTGK